jgi:hypothetical protein
MLKKRAAVLSGTAPARNEGSLGERREMKPRTLFNRHFFVPYALICGYGLFAATTPPTTSDATFPVAVPTATQPVDPPAVTVAERTGLDADEITEAR